VSGGVNQTWSTPAGAAQPHVRMVGGGGGAGLVIISAER
jgi:hypothetical protein